MKFADDSISAQIWDIKYRYRLNDQIKDKIIEDTWLRVARAAARAEKLDQRKHWQKSFYQILENFRFLPGGRILAGAGTEHRVTLFNCFVMNIAEDSMAGIFNALKEGALTLQQGGGVGYDFSVLRPEGDVAKKTGIVASGPVSFMKIWDAMCGVLLSTGARRGAMMGVLRCDHPDIESFVAAKSNPLALRHFNVSVFVTDAFMRAVKQNADWHLVFPDPEASSSRSDIVIQRWPGYSDPISCRIHRTVKARELWKKIIKSAYEYAEPGVLFEDTINRLNTLWYRETIGATNPCGEIPLPSYGACNLGSINLTQFIKNPFTKNAELDWDALKDISRIATRFLDNIIDISRYPLPQQKKEALATRRIGLGITGLANAFVMLGCHYGSPESLKLAKTIMSVISQTSWLTSCELAKEKGSFPDFQSKNYLAGEFVKELPQTVRDKILLFGMRNSHHNTIAPTGTVSILAHNVSSGIEPIFSGDHERSVLISSGERKNFKVTDYALQLWRSLNKSEKFPPAWIDSQSLTPMDHLKMQRAVQPFIDNAISKTINIPENFPFEKLNSVYTHAFDYELKGCTIFRPNPITGSVLSIADPEEDIERCCQV